MFRGVKTCSTFVYTVLIFAEEVPNDPLGCDQSAKKRILSFINSNYIKTYIFFSGRCCRHSRLQLIHVQVLIGNFIIHH